jgi:hypothetical protein
VFHSIYIYIVPATHKNSHNAQVGKICKKRKGKNIKADDIYIWMAYIPPRRRRRPVARWHLRNHLLMVDIHVWRINISTYTRRWRVFIDTFSLWRKQAPLWRIVNLAYIMHGRLFIISLLNGAPFRCCFSFIIPNVSYDVLLLLLEFFSFLFLCTALDE